MTSSRRTGSCALDPEVGETIADPRSDLSDAASPLGRLPDLEMAGDADDDRFALEPRVFAEMRRDDDPPLPVRLRVMRARHQEVGELEPQRIRARPFADVDVDRLPFVGREDREAFPYPTRHDRSFFEAGSELGWDRQPTLLVQAVGEFAQEIPFQVPFRLLATVPHRPPLLTTRRAFSPT